MNFSNIGFVRFLKQSVSSALLKAGLVILLILTIGVYAAFGPSGILRSYDIPGNKFILIPKGANLKKISEILVHEDILPSENTFVLAAILSGSRTKLKPGEYAIPSQVSPLDMVKLLASGKIVKRKVTVVEGASVFEIKKMLEENPVMTGEITTMPEEGFLLPDTYFYNYGDDRQSILDRMKKAMQDFLNQYKAEIQNHILLRGEKEIITLASLIEKETAIHDERPYVSAVFLNRLLVKMRLQCDPTVIYGVTKGGKLDRPLSRNDLEMDSPYNTYKINGLPIGPIGCPGKASIAAVFFPANTDALYFVADGSGGHTFARTLEAHNENVRLWRMGQRRMGEKNEKTIEEPTIIGAQDIQSLYEEEKKILNEENIIEKKKNDKLKIKKSKKVKSKKKHLRNKEKKNKK